MDCKLKKKNRKFLQKNNESEKRDTMHDMKETRFWFFSMNLRSSRNMTFFWIYRFKFLLELFSFFYFQLFLIFTVNFFR